MARSFFRLSLSLLLFVVFSGAADAARKIPAFHLPDQNWRLTEVVPSGLKTLVISYRGDW